MEKPARFVENNLLPALLSFALLTILFSFPEPTIRVNQPFKAELLLSLALVAILAAAFRKWPPVMPIARSFSYLFGSFVVFSLASSIWAASIGSVLHHTLLWAVYIAFFIAASSRLEASSSLKSVTNTFIITSLILGMLCVSDYLTITDFAASEGTIRIRYGKYAELLVTLSPVVWALTLYARGRGRIIAGIAAILSWSVVMLSLSKGAFIAGIAGFLLMFIGIAAFSQARFRKRAVVTAAVWFVFTSAFQIAFSSFSAVPSTTDYLTGSADPTRSTSAMRVFTWSVGRQMISDNLTLGVGADNFGIAFNNARVPYRIAHPNDPKDETGEDFLVERAHNEPLQVLAELGIIGLVLFAAPFGLFGFYFIRKLLEDKFRLSPMLWASVAGMSAFGVSSLFSSFSFRSAQNGVVFFLVFAVAVHELSKHGKTPSKPETTAVRSPSYWFAWIAAVLMIVFCVTKVIAQYHVYTAERTQSSEDAGKRYTSALMLDPGYAGAYLSQAARSASENDHQKAADLTQQAIANGTATSQIYADLARYLTLAGDVNGADAAYRAGLSVYPRSVYLRAEYVVFLENSGQVDMAAKQLGIAHEVDLRQANGWYALIREGGLRAFYRSQNDPLTAKPSELFPAAAVPRYVEKIPGM